jgi:hypothetical protein
MDLWAEPLGYAVIRGRTKYRKDKPLQKAWVICDWGKNPQLSVAAADSKRPNRGTKKTECPARFQSKQEGRGPTSGRRYVLALDLFCTYLTYIIVRTSYPSFSDGGFSELEGAVRVVRRESSR